MNDVPDEDGKFVPLPVIEAGTLMPSEAGTEKQQIPAEQLDRNNMPGRAEADRQRLLATLGSRERELVELRLELDRVLKSRSWRATRFLRAIQWKWRLLTEQRVDVLENRIDASGDQHGALEDLQPPTQHVVSPPVADPGEFGVFPDLRIAIITPDFLGPIRNGGIGTAFTELAKQLSAWNAELTVAYALGNYSETTSLPSWTKYYQNIGIKLLPLDDVELGDDITIDAPQFCQLSWRIFHWLQRHETAFDLVIFPEWMGLAYYTLLAKGQGIAFKNVEIAINAHSPEAWATEGNQSLPNYVALIERDFMERESVRRADWVISPSHYMIEWMQSRKWVLPNDIRIIQNLISAQPFPIEADHPAQKLETLVFFGRLEHRKGLKLFCDAIDRMPTSRRAQIRLIRFLGKVVMLPGNQSSLQFIHERARHWNVKIDISSSYNKDEALTELCRPGALAVIASLSENSPYTVLECLNYHIPFIAARVGGIPELVAEGDAARCFFQPTPQSLARCIEGILDHGIPLAQMAQPQHLTREKWHDWFAEVARTRAGASLEHEARHVVAKEPPLVSICLVHYDRPKYLQQSLASIRMQSYSNIEVVLVDDGSPSVEAQRFIDGLEAEFKTRDWQIIRQENNYLGAARNRAAAAARGQYLLFMDDDNLAMPHEVETFLRAMEHSGADILTSPSALFTDEIPDRVTSLWLPLGGAAGAGVYRNVFGDANAFWTKAAYEKFGGYTTDYGLGHEDWELFASAVLAGAKLELLPVPLFWYRVRADSMLRMGNKLADNARSARAYLRHDPSGLGMALSYAVHLNTKAADVLFSDGPGKSRLKLLWRALMMAKDPSLRSRFMGMRRSRGFVQALRLAVRKANQ